MNSYRGKHVSSAPWPVSSSSSYRRGRHQKRNRRRRRWMIMALVLVAVLFCYPLVEARIVLTERKELHADNLPAEANNLRIVFLSDIHYGHWFSGGDLERMISRINGLRPDLVLFGGDYATDNHTAIRFFEKLREIDRIHSRYGVFGIIGEADRGESDFDLTRLTEAMANADVTPLVNQVVPVNIGAARIYIAGLDDMNTGKPDLKAVSRKVSAGDYVILLCHNPSVIPDAHLATDSGGNLGWFDLGLFGHTHGGQMLFFSSLFDFAEDVPDRYRSGWMKENRVDLLISRGVGTTGFPGRLFCFPQIHYITVSY